MVKLRALFFMDLWIGKCLMNILEQIDIENVYLLCKD
jgi:hypothetical protein